MSRSISGLPHTISISVIEQGPLPWENPNNVFAQISMCTHKKNTHISDRQTQKARLTKERKPWPDSKCVREGAISTTDAG